MSISYNYDQENKNPYSAQGPQRQPTKKPPESKPPQWLSWLIIGILLFSGAWYVGIPWLLFKLFGSENKKTVTFQAPPLHRESTRTGSEQTQEPQKESAQKTGRAERADTESKKASGRKDADKSGFWRRALLIAGGIILAFISLGALSDAADVFATSFTLGGLFDLCMGFAFLAGSVAMVYSAVASKSAQTRYKRFLTIIGDKQAIDVASLASVTGLKEKRVRKDLQNMVDKGLFGPHAYLNEELGYLFLSSQADEALRNAREAAHLAENVRQAAQTPDIYEDLLRQIRDVNDRIPDAVMTQKIDTIENVTRLIFREIQKNPSKVKRIDRFLNYYLPTTMKLLESYAQLDKTGLESENVAESMASIEGAMDSIVDGFKNLLDSLYDTNVVDIKSDIDVMQQMMRSDGTVAGKDFTVK